MVWQDRAFYLECQGLAPGSGIKWDARSDLPGQQVLTVSGILGGSLQGCSLPASGPAHPPEGLFWLQNGTLQEGGCSVQVPG